MNGSKLKRKNIDKSDKPGTGIMADIKQHIQETGL